MENTLKIALPWRFGKKRPKWEDASLQDHQNLLIAVTGEEVLYGGKPQIIAYTPKKIEVIPL